MSSLQNNTKQIYTKKDTKLNNVMTLTHFNHAELKTVTAVIVRYIHLPDDGSFLSKLVVKNK